MVSCWVGLSWLVGSIADPTVAAAVHSRGQNVPCMHARPPEKGKADDISEKGVGAQNSQDKALGSKGSRGVTRFQPATGPWARSLPPTVLEARAVL